MPKYSISEENYIKTIFNLQRADNNVTTSELAAQLLTKPASVTDMLKKLCKKKFVHYRPYRGFRLTATGKKMAITIIRRHRLWEYFLANKLNFKWDEVHAVAEELEHVRSKKLIDKLDEFLNFPKFDPHGDPIPDHSGKMEIKSKFSLAEWPLHKPAIVCQVVNQTAELLELLQQKKISIGTKLELKRRFEFDGSVEVVLKKQAPIIISEYVAKTILVNHETENK